MSEVRNAPVTHNQGAFFIARKANRYHRRLRTAESDRNVVFNNKVTIVSGLGSYLKTKRLIK